MQIILNGTPTQTEARSLAALLEEQALSGRVATAVNESFVPAPARAGTALQPGDRVEVLAPMQGG